MSRMEVLIDLHGASLQMPGQTLCGWVSGPGRSHPSFGPPWAWFKVQGVRFEPSGIGAGLPPTCLALAGGSRGNSCERRSKQRIPDSLSPWPAYGSGAIFNRCEK
jgi:hypothetical protein